MRQWSKGFRHIGLRTVKSNQLLAIKRVSCKENQRLSLNLPCRSWKKTFPAPRINLQRNRKECSRKMMNILSRKERKGGISGVPKWALSTHRSLEIPPKLQFFFFFFKKWPHLLYLRKFPMFFGHMFCLPIEAWKFHQAANFFCFFSKKSLTWFNYTIFPHRFFAQKITCIITNLRLGMCWSTEWVQIFIFILFV